MVVPIGSFGDIIAIIEAVITICQAFSEKAGSKNRYRELKHQLLDDTRLLLMAKNALTARVDGMHDAPWFEEGLGNALVLYEAALENIRHDIEGYGILSRVSRRSKGVVLSTRESTDGDQDKDERTLNLKMKEVLKTLVWATFKEKGVNEKLGFFKDRRDSVRWYLGLLEMHHDNIKAVESLVLAIHNRDRELHRGPTQQLVLLHDMFGETWTLHPEFCQNRNNLTEVIRILFRDSSAERKSVIYKGDFDISCENGSGEGSEMVLRDTTWPKRIRPGSNVYLTAVVHERAGGSCRRKSEVCPACGTDNSTTSKSRNGMTKCAMQDCGRWFSVSEVEDTVQSGNKLLSRPYTAFITEADSQRMVAGPPPPPPPSSSAEDEDLVNEADILRSLKRLRIEVTFTKRKPPQPHHPRDHCIASTPASLHSIFSSAYFSFDVLRAIRPGSNPRVSSSTMMEPATNPPLSHLIIHCENFIPAYSLEIKSADSVRIGKDEGPSKREQTGKGVITVGEVLRAIQSVIYEPLQREHLDTLNDIRRTQIQGALERRLNVGGIGTRGGVGPREPTVRDWIVVMKRTFVKELCGAGSSQGKGVDGNEWTFNFTHKAAKRLRYGQSS